MTALAGLVSNRAAGAAAPASPASPASPIATALTPLTASGWGRWRRRARPLLGTLVEVGLSLPIDGSAGGLGWESTQPDEGAANAAFDAAFAAIQSAQACLSRFETGSDIARFNALRGGERLRLRPITRDVLQAAYELHTASGGVFDISQGTAPQGWRLDGDWLEKCDDRTQLDLAGIGKGHAVDLAVLALQGQGCAAGWVNAGGDLRVFGALDLPLQLRCETGGGVRPFGSLRDGAFATSALGGPHRARLVGVTPTVEVHVSVAAPLCLWADALTKVVAANADANGGTCLALLARFGAQAWRHGDAA